MKEYVYILKNYNVSGMVIKENEVGIVYSKNEQTVDVHFVGCDNSITIPLDMIRFFDPLQTGDNYDYKVCNRCNRLLPVDNFPKNQNGKNNRTVRRPSCRECRTMIDGVGVSVTQKRQWESSKPNMEIWKCPICGKKTIPGLTSKVVLDHNHKTGVPNAWICDSCNTGLGRFEDDIHIMESAIEYLKKYDK